MIKLVCITLMAVFLQSALAILDDNEEVLREVNELHQRVFAPEPGQELSLDEILNLLKQSNNLLEVEINDEIVGQMQNDLCWLKALDSGPDNCNPEWISLIKLGEALMPKSAYVDHLYAELTSRKLALCLDATTSAIQEVKANSPAIRGSLAYIESLVSDVKQHANGASLVGDLNGSKIAVAKGFIDFLEQGIGEKLPETSIATHLKLVAEVSSEILEPSCRTLDDKFSDQYGFFHKMMASNKNIQLEPELIGWYEALNLCKTIFLDGVENLFLIGKYDPIELANELKTTNSKSEQANLLDIYRRVGMARKLILNENLEDIQTFAAQSS